MLGFHPAIEYKVDVVAWLVISTWKINTYEWELLELLFRKNPLMCWSSSRNYIYLTTIESFVRNNSTALGFLILKHNLLARRTQRPNVCEICWKALRGPRCLLRDCVPTVHHNIVIVTSLKSLWLVEAVLFNAVIFENVSLCLLENFTSYMLSNYEIMYEE